MTKVQPKVQPQRESQSKSPVQSRRPGLKWTLGAAALACAGVLACGKDAAPGEAVGEAQAQEKSQDGKSVQVARNSTWMDYVKVQTVTASDAGTSVNLTGKVTFDEEHTQRVASPVDGRVRTVFVKLGDRVKAGQPLLELTSPQVAQIQSDALKAQQDYSLAEKSLARVNTLKGEGAVAEKDAVQASADFKKAKAEVERSSAQLRAYSLSASDPTLALTLKAGLPGVVVERNALVGQEVRADAPSGLVTVTSLDTVWVVADVYEQDLGLVNLSAPVSVVVPAYPGESFSGKVINIGDVVDPASRTVKVRCELANPGGRLKPEMFAKVELHDTSGRQVVRVPTRAVLMNGDKSEVILAQSGRFSVRGVKVGAEQDGQVRVLDGLQPNDVIVTDGAVFVKREISDQ